MAPVAQSSDAVIMVEPTYFRFNEEAAEDNVYMNAPSSDVKDPLAQVSVAFLSLRVET